MSNIIEINFCNSLSYLFCIMNSNFSYIGLDQDKKIVNNNFYFIIRLDQIYFL